MLARSLAILSLLATQPMLPTVSTSVARTISWSGYTWDVRPVGSGGPGANQWSDSPANVRVEGSDLVLAIVQDASGHWTSAEVDNQQHLGYGTYRWVVAGDLSTLDANEVLGMFTYGGSSPSNNEIDIEASHWGNLAWPSGSATVWQDAGADLSQSKSFEYSGRPPYVNQFRWEPGRITYLITDAAGVTLFQWIVTRDVPTPSSEVPMINYWRYDGVAPAAARSMRVSSFTWLPLGAEDPPAPTGGRATSPGPGRSSTASCARVTMTRHRFAVTGRRHGTTIAWTSPGPTKIRLAIERRLRNGRFAWVGSLTRVVRTGGGRMRFGGRVAGRRLRAGRYRLVVNQAHCVKAWLRFTVLAR
jgi:hypothetical protein